MVDKNGLWYVAGCYTRNPWNLPRYIGTPLNVAVAWKCTRKLNQLGYHTITPMMNTAFLDGSNTYEHFMDSCFEIVRRCDGIILLPNWVHSPGAKAEVELAVKLEYPVLFYNAILNGVYDNALH